jgi:phosphate uptake regulator
MPTKRTNHPTRAKKGLAASPAKTETRSRTTTGAEGELASAPYALVLRACLIARDAVFNVRDTLADGSRLAFLAIKDCEKELDQIERKMDEQLPGAITRVGEAKARELLACLRFIIDLERIGDLAYSAVMQLQPRREKLPAADARQLVEMASLLCEMLEQVHQGFLTRDPEFAQKVLHSDPEVDHICHALFQRHLAAHGSSREQTGAQNFDILLAAQALERIGDHCRRPFLAPHLEKDRLFVATPTRSAGFVSTHASLL